MMGIIGAFFTSICYGLVLRVPPSCRITAAANGALAWAIYLYTAPACGLYIATYLGGIAMAVGMHCLARIQKTAATVLLLPSFIPFVPGGDIYRCLYALLQDQPSLAMHSLSNTIAIAGMIALGKISVEGCIQLWVHQHKQMKGR